MSPPFLHHLLALTIRCIKQAVHLVPRHSPDAPGALVLYTAKDPTKEVDIVLDPHLSW